jgi:hypothetical protein
VGRLGFTGAGAAVIANPSALSFAVYTAAIMTRNSRVSGRRH